MEERVDAVWRCRVSEEREVDGYRGRGNMIKVSVNLMMRRQKGIRKGSW